MIETLYGVRVRPSRAETWHPDVKFFAIEDATGALVGQFYLDLYARAAKRGGAWMDDARNRRRLERRRADAGRLPHLQLLRPRWRRVPRSSPTTR